MYKSYPDGYSFDGQQTLATSQDTPNESIAVRHPVLDSARSQNSYACCPFDWPSLEVQSWWHMVYP